MIPPPYPNTAEVYDNALRFKVPSRRIPNEDYLVDLGAYDGLGRCACKDFQIQFEPLIARGRTPEEVWEKALLWDGDPTRRKLRPYQLTPRDCLSCWHLVDGRNASAWQFIKAMVEAAKAQRPR